MWCVKTIIPLLLLFTTLNAYGDSIEPNLYDISMAGIQVGKLRVAWQREAARYSTQGSASTNKFFQRFFSWKGKFSGSGELIAGSPNTRSYRLEEAGRKKRKVTEISDNRLRISLNGEIKVDRQAPLGTDLIAALFIGDACFAKPIIHDGEDTYQVSHTSVSKAIRQGSKYYSGQTLLCKYVTVDDKNRARTVRVWSANIQGRNTPVRIRIGLPMAPDAVMRLRLPTT